MSVWGHRTLRRWRWWIVALVVVITVRVLLPVVLRRVMVSQASQTLNARVDIGDVDLELWRGGVALEDVAIREASGTADGNGAPPGDPPLIGFKRLAAGIYYWPLFSKTVQLREIEFDSPRVALDRLASGDLNLSALVPNSAGAVAAGATPGELPAATPTATATEDAAATKASPWKFGLDRFVLRDGRLRFRDLKLAGSEPVEVGIEQITVNEIALSPGVYGEPAQVNVKLGIDEGVIDVTSRFQVLDKGFALASEVKADRLPLRRARLYVPKVGWSDLQGELDLALAYDLQTETDPKNELHGTLGLRNVAVTVPHLEGVAAQWEKLAVDIDTIDLQHQRAALRDVALGGAQIYVRARGDQPLPVLAEPASPTPEGSPEPTPSASPAPTEEAENTPPAEPAKAWEWQVAAVTISDSTVHVMSDQPTLDVGLNLTARDLSGAADAISHIALALGVSAAKVDLDGDLRLTSPAFGGTLKIADLALPPLLAVSGVADPALLPSASLTTDLTIGAGLPAKEGSGAEPNQLALNGTIALRDVRLVPPGEPALSVDAKSVDLSLADVLVPGIIPIGEKPPADAVVRIGTHQLAIQQARVERAGDQPLSVAVESLNLSLSDVTGPGFIPIGANAPPDAALRVGAQQLAIQQARVELGGAQPLSAGVESLTMRLADVAAPAALIGLAPFESAQPIASTGSLDIAQPRFAMGNDLTAGADAIGLVVKQSSIAAVPRDGNAGAAEPATLAADLTLRAPKVAMAGTQLDAGAQAIGLSVAELTMPGVTVGAPPVDTGQPLHAVATLNLTSPRVARGDGKEFSMAAQSIALPLKDLSATGLLAPAANPAPLRAALGDVRVDAPVIRMTRTKDGLVLPTSAAPGAAAPPRSAPAPAGTRAADAPPAAGRAAPQVTIASFRLSKGKVDFNDRAVQPAVTTRLAPIEIEARDVRWPDGSVKPVRVDITNADQGHLVLTGDLSPQGGQLKLAITDWALPPYTSYATAYSPYSLTDGALEIKTTAQFSGGKYEVENAVTLHQLDLGGVAGDSLFEQQFGVPLSMALALLRDASGDISLNVPVQVDQSGGTTVDTVAVIRTALRQALLGAVESPLKLVGGVLGMGGSGGKVAPAPIAFHTGTSEPTDAGAQSAERLAQFLTSRPAMAVQLSTAPTEDDLRWLREQALRAEWQDEGVFKRSIGFITSRGPRERIGSYLAARGDGATADLSDEDKALLQQWLDERPAPPANELITLATARLAAVDTILKEKNIDAARITHEDTTGELTDGAPVVKISFHPLAAGTQARGPSNDAEEGQ